MQTWKLGGGGGKLAYIFMPLEGLMLTKRAWQFRGWLASLGLEGRHGEKQRVGINSSSWKCYPIRCVPLPL